MSVITTADEKRDLLFDKLNKVSELIQEIDELSEQVFDKNTWGSELWSKIFRQDTRRLADHLHFTKKDILEYLEEYV